MQAKQFQMRLNWLLGILERSFIGVCHSCPSLPPGSQSEGPELFDIPIGDLWSTWRCHVTVLLVSWLPLLSGLLPLASPCTHWNCCSSNQSVVWELERSVLFSWLCCDSFRCTQAAAFQNGLRKWGGASGWGCANCPKYIRWKKTMNGCSVIATLNPRHCSICKDKLTRERAGRNSGSSLKKILSFDKPLEGKLCGTASYQI